MVEKRMVDPDDVHVHGVMGRGEGGRVWSFVHGAHEQRLILRGILDTDNPETTIDVVDNAELRHAIGSYTMNIAIAPRDAAHSPALREILAGHMSEVLERERLYGNPDQMPLF